MSKCVSYFCNRCGAEIVGCSAHAVASESAQIKLWAPGEYRAGPGQRIDLCVGCFEKFIDFIEGGVDE